MVKVSLKSEDGTERVLAETQTDEQGQAGVEVEVTDAAGHVGRAFVGTPADQLERTGGGGSEAGGCATGGAAGLGLLALGLIRRRRRGA